MPLDAPPPLMAGGPPAPPDAQGPSTMTSALTGMAGMGTQGAEVPGLLKVAADMILKASQATDDPQLKQGLAQVISLITDLVSAQQQGMGAGPMASNGMGAPPQPGPLPANAPSLMSANQGMPPPSMLPRASMLGP